MPGISVQSCVRLVEATAAQCKAAAQPISEPKANPDFDALAASLAAQSNAISAQANYLTLGSIIFAVIAIVVAVGWGWLVKHWAEKAARDAVNDWMNQNAPGEIARILANLTPSSIDGGPVPSPPMSQEQQEEGLGAEPAEEPK